jgi:hypothetical protein
MMTNDDLAVATLNHWRARSQPVMSCYSTRDLVTAIPDL